MKDEFNIRELYEEMMQGRANVNGHVILEYVNLSSERNTPEFVDFGEISLEYGDPSARAFSFIGGSDLIGYIDDGDGTHPTIFMAFNILAAALGLSEFPTTAQVAKAKWGGSKKSQAKKILASYGVSYFGNLTDENLSNFVNNQWEGTMSNTRRNTTSGRLWRGVNSKEAGGVVDIVAFWSDSAYVSNDTIKSLIDTFKLGEVFWCAMDSAKFNYYGSEQKEGNTKKLKSKIYPQTTHDQIVGILMRAHSDLRLTPWEKKIVDEFRGNGNPMARSITGGYPTRAEYNYRSKFSEGYRS